MKKVSRLYTMCICSSIKIATLWSSVGRSGNVDIPDGEKMHYRLIVLLVLCCIVKMELIQRPTPPLLPPLPCTNKMQATASRDTIELYSDVIIIHE